MVIIHGLTGASESSYVKAMAKEGIRNGYTPAVMQGRGYNQTILSTPQLSTGEIDNEFRGGIQSIEY